MIDYVEKELTDKIEFLEMELSKYKVTEGLNMLHELMCEYGLEKDPRYTEGTRKIVDDNCKYIELTSQLKARVWQLKDVINQIKQNKIGNYLLKKCKTRQTF